MLNKKLKIFIFSVLSAIICACIVLSIGLYMGWFGSSSNNYIQTDLAYDLSDNSDNFIVTDSKEDDYIFISTLKLSDSNNEVVSTAAEVSFNYESVATVSATLSDNISEYDITFTLSYSDEDVTDTLSDSVCFSDGSVTTTVSSLYIFH